MSRPVTRPPHDRTIMVRLRETTHDQCRAACGPRGELTARLASDETLLTRTPTPKVPRHPVYAYLQRLWGSPKGRVMVDAGTTAWPRRLQLRPARRSESYPTARSHYRMVPREGPAPWKGLECPCRSVLLTLDSLVGVHRTQIRASSTDETIHADGPRLDSAGWVDPSLEVSKRHGRDTADNARTLGTILTPTLRAYDCFDAHALQPDGGVPLRPR